MSRRGTSIVQGVQTAQQMSMSAMAAQDRQLREQRIAAATARAIETADAIRNFRRNLSMGSGRLADDHDAAKADLLNHNGIFLGALGNTPIFANGDGPLLTYGRTRSGKGRDIILPNLAHVANRSVVVCDVKDGENAYASWLHRFQKLGQDIVFVNPWKLNGLPNSRVNPCQRVIAVAAMGKQCTEEALEVATFLLPKPKGNNGAAGEREEWTSGARDMISTRIEYLAHYAPDHCNLAEVWKMANSSLDKIQKMYEDMAECDAPHIAGRAGKFLRWLLDVPKQYEGYAGALSTALMPYQPGSELAEATSATDFDFATLKHKLTTVYIMIPDEKLATRGDFVAMMFSIILSTIARTRGAKKTLFILDEMANLPAMDIVPLTLRLYAGKGVQLWGFCQGRYSLQDAGYSEHTVKEFEDQANVLQLWGVEDPRLIDDVAKWSGKMTVQNISRSVSWGETPSSSISSNEVVRDVLQPEDIRSTGDGQQILRIPGMPLFVASRIPWFDVRRYQNMLRDVRKIADGTTDVERKVLEAHCVNGVVRH